MNETPQKLTIHSDLSQLQNFVYPSCWFNCTQLAQERESKDYGAYSFKLNELTILFRAAKITPTKMGQFVTLWKRTEKGPIQPYDFSDPVDFFVISTRRENYWGQFVFPKLILCQKGIISQKGKGGKLGIRVYPPWDNVINSQAQRTQKWQLDYFVNTSPHSPIDCSKFQKLYTLG